MADYTHLSSSALSIRRFNATDNVSEVTALLRAAYAMLGEMGLNYTATYQDDEITRRRCAKGECYLAFIDEELVATVTLEPPSVNKNCEWFRKSGVASFHQFGVLPHLRGAGLGSRMMAFVEQRAKELGAIELAIDTAEPATHLVAFYEKRGYRIVDHVQWDGKNYRSVVMSKKI